MVSIQGKQRFLGEAAASIARSNYRNTIGCIKRFIGRQFSEPELAAEMARSPGLKFVEMPDGTVGVEVSYDGSPVRLSMPQVAGMMLFKLSQICAAQEANKGVGVAEAVMSVPAWFTNAQRLAMLDAYHIAGLKCLRLMHDTTATALEYGIWRSVQKMFDGSKGSRVLFVDVGYSSYQVSVVEYLEGKLHVKATTFDRNLGGRDFDHAIAQYVAAEFKAKYPSEDDPLASPKSTMKLLDACEKAKKTLSPHGVTEANLYIECLVNDRDFSMKLSLEKFEELVGPLLDRLAPPIQQALAESSTDPAQLASVEIIGGGSRVASVKRRLAATLGLDASATNAGLSTTLNADEAVAKGCAMQAAMLSPRFKVKPFDIVEAAPFAINLSWDSPSDPAPMETGDEASTKATAKGAAADDEEEAAAEGNQTQCTLFKRNGETPKDRRITFRKYSDFSLRATYADPSALPPAAPGLSNADIGEFDIKGVPPPPPDAGDDYHHCVRVHVSHGIHGTISVPTAHLVQQEVVEEETAKPTTPMDTSKDEEDGKAAAASSSAEAPPTKKKRKQKKTALVVDVKLPSMDRKAIDAAIELEAQMANADRVIQETNDMRNELEAYIYKMRDEIIDSLRPYVSDADKARFEQALNDAETWLYDGDGYDASKSQYAARLDALKKLGDPVTARKRDEAERSVAVAALQQKLEDLKVWANSQDEAFDHISDDEKTVVRDEANKATAWLMDFLDKQGSRATYEDPVLTSADIRKRLDEVQSVVKPIMQKPKPKPPKEEAKTADDAPKADAKQPNPDAAKQQHDGKDGDVDMPDAAEQPPRADEKDVDMPDAPATDKTKAA